MFKILLLNGPNLNLLGRREPGHYGTTTLADIESQLRSKASQSGHHLDCLQSNLEGELIDRIQQAMDDQTDFILINPGALTHTSIGIRDALLAVNIPFIEIHLSNVHQREPFRHHSYLSDIASGIIIGLGVQGYDLAFQAALNLLGTKRKSS